MPDDYAPPETLRRAPAAGGGELVLRRRTGAGPSGQDVLELIVDGVFAMDTVQVSSELRLASDTLSRLVGGGWRVLVGGLGFGYTLRELLADQRVTHVDLVEVEPALVAWVRDGLVPAGRGLLDDPRVHVVVDDLRSCLDALAPSSYDAILLDVDNGPDFLVHQSNSPLYDESALGTAVRALRPDGRLAIWSAAPSAELESRLRSLAASVDLITLPVRREGRSFDYVIYLAGRA